jgi:TolB-like protein/Tfp pilus assembly protein PilF
MDGPPNLLQIRLLGGFELRSGDGRDVASFGRKTRAMVACLALSLGKPWPREKLMALLWSDRGEEQARASLRQVLAELRRGLDEPSPLRTEHDAVSLDPAMIALDAVAFEQLMKAGRLNEAALLYRGPLLDGHGVRDDAFEDWLRVERTRLHNLAIDVVDRLAASQSGEAAIETAQRLLQLDPAREETHRLLMRLYTAAGQRAHALRQYQQCRDTLQRELQAQPDIETERLYRRIQDEPTPSMPARANAAEPARAHPPDSRPSIAVLPFENQSGDPEQQYFSDGITQDIITELARDRSLLMMARNSCFRFRGPSVDIAKVRRELNVSYVVEGSVRKAGNRLRITAQLIDARTQSHLWAERYDREMEDIFAVQDEVAHAVAATLEGRIAASGAEHARRTPTKDWVAYDYFLQGRECVNDYRLEQADSFFVQAIELDPSYAQAHAWRAIALSITYLIDERQKTLDEASTSALRALALNENDAWSHSAMGLVALRRRQLDLAGQHFDRAFVLNPNDVNTAGDRAQWLLFVGRLDEALSCIELALRRDPYPPTWAGEVHGHILYHLKRYDEAIVALRSVHAQVFWVPCFLAAAYAQAGRRDDAGRELANLQYLKPGASLASVARWYSRGNQSLRDHLIDGLRKAGLAE